MSFAKGFSVLALARVLGAETAAAQTLAYVSDNATGTVQVVDAATGTVVASVPIGNLPGDLAATPNSAFVHVVTGNGVSVLSVATNAVVATIPIAQPARIALTPNGAFAYVSSTALKEQCRNGGWATFSNPSFHNQGDCIAYVNQLP